MGPKGNGTVSGRFYLVAVRRVQFRRIPPRAAIMAAVRMIRQEG